MADDTNVNDQGRMENQNPEEVQVGDNVSVIPAGEFQLFDPNNGILYQAGQVTEGPMTRFVEEQIALGNLVLTSDENAPKANEDLETQKLEDPNDPTLRTPENDPALTEDQSQIEDGDVSAVKETGTAKKSRRTV